MKVPSLVAATGQRAGIRLLEFFAANISAPAHTPGLLPRRGRNPDLARECRCAVIVAIGPMRTTDGSLQARCLTLGAASSRVPASTHATGDWLVIGQVTRSIRRNRRAGRAASSLGKRRCSILGSARCSTNIDISIHAGLCLCGVRRSHHPEPYFFERHPTLITPE